MGRIGGQRSGRRGGHSCELVICRYS
jgi:hypothetical protein